MYVEYLCVYVCVFVCIRVSMLCLCVCMYEEVDCDSVSLQETMHILAPQLKGLDLSSPWEGISKRVHNVKISYQLKISADKARGLICREKIFLANFLSNLINVRL